jgi:hypothetical protein
LWWWWCKFLGIHIIVPETQSQQPHHPHPQERMSTASINVYRYQVAYAVRRPEDEPQVVIITQILYFSLTIPVF